MLSQIAVCVAVRRLHAQVPGGVLDERLRGPDGAPVLARLEPGRLQVLGSEGRVDVQLEHLPGHVALGVLAAANLDGEAEADEYPDVVAAVSVSDVMGGFEVWLNQGDHHPGWLGSGDETTMSNATYSAETGRGQAIALADFDRDGSLDVILGTRTGSNTGALEIWLNSGYGTFTQRGL